MPIKELPLNEIPTETSPGMMKCFFCLKDAPEAEMSAFGISKADHPLIQKHIVGNKFAMCNTCKEASSEDLAQIFMDYAQAMER